MRKPTINEVQQRSGAFDILDHHNVCGKSFTYRGRHCENKFDNNAGLGLLRRGNVIEYVCCS